MRLLGDDKVVRIGRNRGLTLIGVAAFLAVLIVSAPAALVAPMIKETGPGVSIQLVEGTIWHARIRGLQADGVYIGDVRADIVLPRLFGAAISYKVKVNGSAVNGRAVLSRSLFDHAEIRNANIEIGRDLLSRYALLGVPVDGSMKISNARISANSNGCVDAKGTLETDALSAVSKQFGAGALDLNGHLQCIDGNLSAILQGEQSDIGAVTVDLTQLAGSRYRMKVTIETRDEALKQSLILAGFQNSGDAIFYEEIARWSGPPQDGPAVTGNLSAGGGV